MKILHVIGSTNLGGVQIFIKDLSKYDKKYGINRNIVCIYNAMGDLNPEFNKLKIPIYSCPIYPLDRQWRPYTFWKKVRIFFSIFFPVKLYYLIKKIKPDIVVIDEHSYLLSQLTIISMMHIPILLHIHAEYMPIGNSYLFKTIYRILLAKWIFLIADSRYVIESNFEFISEYLYQKYERIPVIRSCSDLNIISSKVSERRFNSIEPKKEIIIGSVGRLNWAKGYKYLIDAIDIIKDKVEFKINVFIAGDGRLKSSLQSQVEKRGLLSVIKFLGSIKNIPNFLASLNIYVQPSISEAGGISVMEAMVCGLPIIASRTGGIAENIIHKETGILVQPGNTLELAEAINNMISMSEKQRQSIGEKAKIFALTEFDLNKNAKKITDIYKHIIDNSPFTEKNIYI